MFITGGYWKGQTIFCNNSATHSTSPIRPTRTAHRQAIFNILYSLNYPLKNKNILDAYAGTGAMGFEALSRGALHCVFIDNSKEAIDLIHKTTQKLHIQDRVITYNTDLTKPWKLPFLTGLNATKIDVAFLDPPYTKNMVSHTLNLMLINNIFHTHSIVIVEESRKVKLTIPNEMTILTKRVKGSSVFNFLSFTK